MGVLFGKGGFYGNVLRVKPPLCLTREDAVFALDVLGRAFEGI
jgi:alanine-glyoxylate transaminase/(R)-3-amino-2-methylpropionate-pyruvate transaminase